MAALILLVIVVAIVLWMIGAYNRLISLKNQVRTPGSRSTCSSSAGTT